MQEGRCKFCNEYYIGKPFWWRAAEYVDLTQIFRFLRRMFFRDDNILGV